MALSRGGNKSQPSTTPAHVAASGVAKVSFHRLYVGGAMILFMLLLTAYAMWIKSEQVTMIIALASSTSGYLLGSSSRRDN